MDSFSFSDLNALPDPEERIIERVFEARGRKWPIKIYADGRENATRFYGLMGAIQKAKIECEAPGENSGLRFTTVTGKKIEIADPSYLGQLYVLELVAIDPKFNAMEWATFGLKLGPIVMEELLDWVTEENGIGDFMRRKYQQLKNALCAADSKAESSAPASNDSTNSPPSP